MHMTMQIRAFDQPKIRDMSRPTNGIARDVAQMEGEGWECLDPVRIRRIQVL